MTEMWDHFKQCYTQLVEKHVPIKHINNGSKFKYLWVRYKSVQMAKRDKRAKQVVANKIGLAADHVIYQLENEKLQIVLRRQNCTMNKSWSTK